MSIAFAAISSAMITPSQCRMARAALQWSLKVLAKRSRVNHVTINRFETGQAASNPSTLAAIRAALETAGIEFIAENGGGPGVRLRKPGAQPSAADPQHPELRSVRPEDEDRAGPEAPDGDEVL